MTLVICQLSCVKNLVSIIRFVYFKHSIFEILTILRNSANCLTSLCSKTLSSLVLATTSCNHICFLYGNIMSIFWSQILVLLNTIETKKTISCKKNCFIIYLTKNVKTEHMEVVVNKFVFQIVWIRVIRPMVPVHNVNMVGWDSIVTLVIASFQFAENTNLVCYQTILML